MPLYEELVQKYEVHYIAGGAAQNAIRGAQVRNLRDEPYLTISTFFHPIRQSTLAA